MMTHILKCGASGSGKSEDELRDLVASAKAGDTAIILQDPPGELAKNFLLHIADNHLLHRVIYDKFSDTDLIPCYDFLPPSQNPDPLKRYAENEDAVRKMVNLFVRRGGVKDATQSPMIDKWLVDAFRLYIHQDTPVPMYWLAYLYTPTSGVLPYMIEHCTDEDARQQMERLFTLNPQTREGQTGGAERRLRASLLSSAFSLRSSGQPFDFDSFLMNKGILICDGEDTNEDTCSIMMSAITNRVYDFCRRKKVHQVWITQDEAINAGLHGIQESKMLSIVRHWGMHFRILTQALNFSSDEMKDNILQNTSLHRYFCQASPQSAQLAASDLAKRIVDPLKIHHTETRIRTTDDGFQTVTNHSHGHTKDHDGHTISKSSNEQVSHVKKTREVEERQDRYMSLADQETLAQQKLMELKPGWRWDTGRKEPHYEPMEHHLWHHLSGLVSGEIPERALQELKDKKFQKAIDQVRTSLAYRKPILTPPPSSPTRPTTARSASARMEERRGTK